MNLHERLRAELWTSWASMLRSYAGAHGLNSNKFAVVEVGQEEIVVRVGARWVRFTFDEMNTSEGVAAGFEMAEDGKVRLGEVWDEMDMAAEGVTREMFRD
jgi:hypothetical protein